MESEWGGGSRTRTSTTTSGRSLGQVNNICRALCGLWLWTMVRFGLWPRVLCSDVRTLSKRWQIAEKHVIFMVSYIYIVTLSGPSCARPGLRIDCDAKRRFPQMRDHYRSDYFQLQILQSNDSQNERSQAQAARLDTLRYALGVYQL